MVFAAAVAAGASAAMSVAAMMAVNRVDMPPVIGTPAGIRSLE